MSNGARTFTAFLAGVATGAVIGILFAPDSGDNTRRKIRQNLEEYLNKLRAQLGEVGPEAHSSENGTSGLPPQDYRRAEELLREVEGLISEMKA